MLGTMKLALPKEIAIGLLFFLLVLVATFGAFSIKHIIMGGIICAVEFAVAVITLLTTAITRDIIGRRNISKRKLAVRQENHAL